ncbi:MAG: cytochrome P450 [Anaerolineae bacterium]|nr:cytochrome P450 [Anaerolineae bacterium]
MTVTSTAASLKPTPPQMNGLPVIGNVMEFMKDRTALLQRGYRQFGSIFSIKLGPKPVAVLFGEEAQEAFFAHTDKELRMDKAYGLLRASFGDIAFAAPPETYFAQRHILHAPFKGQMMAGYISIMNEEVQKWLDGLGDSGEIDITNRLIPLIQNVAGHAIMGKEFHDRMGQEFWALYADIGKALDPVLPPNLPLPKFQRRDRAKAKMHEILKPLIAERRASPDQHDDMLQVYATATYKDGRPVEDEVIIGIITALMFAGHETTVGQTAWTILELLRHPAYLAHLYSEVAQVMPYAGKPVDASTLMQLNYVRWAVDETTRLHPSADMIMREADSEIEIGNYRIPAGWLVLLSSTLAQQLPETFRDPERFDPLRFAPDRAEDKQHRFTITGFGGGVHKCAGMNFANNEMAIITAKLFQQYELELLSNDVQITYTEGASRPKNAIVRYRRKPRAAIPVDVMAQAVAAGCPHISGQADQAAATSHN